MTTTQQISINDPRIAAFLTAWHENDSYEAKTAKDRSKYIALDNGTSGVFLVEKATGLVWGIKGYGVPNKRWYIGTIEELTAQYLAANATLTKNYVMHSSAATYPRLAV